MHAALEVEQLVDFLVTESEITATLAKFILVKQNEDRYTLAIQLQYRPEDREYNANAITNNGKRQGSQAVQSCFFKTVSFFCRFFTILPEKLPQDE
jgi:hypothetical protein